MGVLIENIEWMLRHLRMDACPSVLELGDQNMYVWPYQGKALGVPLRFMRPDGPDLPLFRDYLLTLGASEVCSVDIAGTNGSVVANLSQPLDIRLAPGGGYVAGNPEDGGPRGVRFDAATDFGTSEHVADLHQCMKTVTAHLKPGGLFFSVVPEVGSWPGHGYWYRTPEFFRGFCELAGYALVDQLRAPAMGNTKDGWNVWACMRRMSDRPFPTSAEFYQLPLVRGEPVHDSNYRE